MSAAASNVLQMPRQPKHPKIKLPEIDVTDLATLRNIMVHLEVTAALAVNLIDRATTVGSTVIREEVLDVFEALGTLLSA